MFERIGEKVGVAVLSAVMLGALALIWNFATSGGLVASLGGVPKAELTAIIKGIVESDPNLRGPQGPQGESGEPGLIGAIGIPGSAGPMGENGTDAKLPTGAVVAFDVSFQCPEGWSSFREGQSRMIVGATTGNGFAPGLQNNEASRPLVEYKYRAHGGMEAVNLRPGEMPLHTHETIFETWRDSLANGNPGTPVLVATQNLAGTRAGTIKLDSKQSGGNQPHNNMPPYIALYFCKKD